MPFSFLLHSCGYCKDTKDILKDGTLLHTEKFPEHVHHFVECDRCKNISIVITNAVATLDEYLYARYLANNYHEMPDNEKVSDGVDEVRALLERVNKRVNERLKRRLKEERLRVACIVG